MVVIILAILVLIVVHRVVISETTNTKSIEGFGSDGFIFGTDMKRNNPTSYVPGVDTELKVVNTSGNRNINAFQSCIGDNIFIYVYKVFVNNLENESIIFNVLLRKSPGTILDLKSWIQNGEDYKTLMKNVSDPSQYTIGIRVSPNPQIMDSIQTSLPTIKVFTGANFTGDSFNIYPRVEYNITSNNDYMSNKIYLGYETPTGRNLLFKSIKFPKIVLPRFVVEADTYNSKTINMDRVHLDNIPDLEAYLNKQVIPDPKIILPNGVQSSWYFMVDSKL